MVFHRAMLELPSRCKQYLGQTEDGVYWNVTPEACYPSLDNISRTTFLSVHFRPIEASYHLSAYAQNEWLEVSKGQISISFQRPVIILRRLASLTRYAYMSVSKRPTPYSPALSTKRGKLIPVRRRQPTAAHIHTQPRAEVSFALGGASVVCVWCPGFSDRGGSRDSTYIDSSPPLQRWQAHKALHWLGSKCQQSP